MRQVTPRAAALIRHCFDFASGQAPSFNPEVLFELARSPKPVTVHLANRMFYADNPALPISEKLYTNYEEITNTVALPTERGITIRGVESAAGSLDLRVFSRPVRQASAEGSEPVSMSGIQVIFREPPRSEADVKLLAELLSEHFAVDVWHEASKWDEAIMKELEPGTELAYCARRFGGDIGAVARPYKESALLVYRRYVEVEVGSSE